MPIEKEPFTSYKLDEERLVEKTRTITVRLSKEEEVWLNELKELFDVKSDGKILKIGAASFLKVLHSHFSPSFLKYLFKKDRVRLSDYKSF